MNAIAAFDENAHTVDVRQIDATAPRNRGRYNVNNIGVFLWRTEPMRMERSPLRPHGTDRRRYRFEPEGHDRPLFGLPHSGSFFINNHNGADGILLETTQVLTGAWFARNEYYGFGGGADQVSITALGAGGDLLTLSLDLPELLAGLPVLAMRRVRRDAAA